MSTIVRVELPANLCRLARSEVVVPLAIEERVTLQAILDALEAKYPMLEGTIRDYASGSRRPFIRFFACEQDLSNIAPDEDLPPAVQQGAEPLLIVGAIAGG